MNLIQKWLHFRHAVYLFVDAMKFSFDNHVFVMSGPDKCYCLICDLQTTWSEVEKYYEDEDEVEDEETLEELGLDGGER